MFKCRLCGKCLSELQGSYLVRVNEKGVPGVVEGRNSVYLRRGVVGIRPEGLVRLANAGLWPEELFEMDDL